MAVLAVDDSQTIRELIAQTLQEAGFPVVLAEDAPSALAAAQQQQFQLVLTDVHMPGQSGLELVRDLRRLEGYKYTPILVITTESDPAMKAEGKAAGATGWMVKPFDPLRLVAVIRRVLA